MKVERWEPIISIVGKALTLSGREKETYLSTGCRENPANSSKIEALLRSIEEVKRIKINHCKVGRIWPSNKRTLPIIWGWQEYD